MENESKCLDDLYPNLPKCLSSEEEKVLFLLLLESGVHGDALVGNMLLLKNAPKDMDEMILYIWDNHPTPEKIDEKLVEIVSRRPLSQRAGDLYKSQNSSKKRNDARNSKKVGRRRPPRKRG